jgi:hypothetical protein
MRVVRGYPGLIFFFPEDMGTRKIKPLLWTFGGNTAHTAWQVAMLPTSVH